MEEQHPVPVVELQVQPQSFHLFTTVLQSGIEIKTSEHVEMGAFLCELPGFTPDYITSTVETIFLNGTPVDDLHTHFSGEKPVLALSAAMPGLAGAIFRKNSIHSALRTRTNVDACRGGSNDSITVTLKLFNSIAKTQGIFLLDQGVDIRAEKLHKFLDQREQLYDSITQITLNGEYVAGEALAAVLEDLSLIRLRVKTGNG